MAADSEVAAVLQLKNRNGLVDRLVSKLRSEMLSIHKVDKDCLDGGDFIRFEKPVDGTGRLADWVGVQLERHFEMLIVCE